MNDADRFAIVDRLNQSAPADVDADFLRRAEDAGMYYRNSPGAGPSLLGMRDTLMADLGRQLKSLEARFEQRLDDIERRTATAPARKSGSGVSWPEFKTMTPEQQRSAVEALSPYQFVMLFHGKVAENLQVLETRLLRLEDALDASAFEASLREGAND